MVLFASSAVLRGDAKALRTPAFGVYAGPATKGVTNAAAFAALTGAPITHVLDFAPSKSWQDITGPSWLIAPHAGRNATFEYSLPMLPDGDGYSLASCAGGAYDTQWRELASNLVDAGLQRTIVRPGWEFNGKWYAWSAVDHARDFAGCFRAVVTSMRGVAGQQFRFDWNPTLGPASMPAEQAYPGDGYVDYVGVDAYDTSQVFAIHHDRRVAARNTAWRTVLHGDHGLAFWSRFAKAHHKQLAIPEWGVTLAANREGGGDDVAYIDRMFHFITDPSHDVAYADYFDAGSAKADHRFGAGTQFPRAQAEFRSWVQLLTG